MKSFFTSSFLCFATMLISGCHNYYDLTASFTTQHIQENHDKVVVRVPPTYELGYVLLSLTAVCRSDSDLVDFTTPYAKEVNDWFGPFKNQQAVIQLNDLIKTNRSLYRYFKDGMLAFRLDKARLIPSEDYGAVSSRINFRHFTSLINDFVQQTHFITFYEQHRPLYQQLIRYEEQQLNIRRIWLWLEENYPTRIQSYQVLLSPLANGYHNTLLLGSGSYKEALMFVSGADENDLAQPGDTLRIAALERVLFTEIDHNYVNPVTEQEREKADKINWQKWNTSTDDYKNGFRTFNEHMTWALYLAFAKERYGAAVYKKVRERETYRLEVLRGFTGFRKFTEELFQRKASTPSATYSTLQPGMIDWMLQTGE